MNIEELRIGNLVLSTCNAGIIKVNDISGSGIISYKDIGAGDFFTTSEIQGIPVSEEILRSINWLDIPFQNGMLWYNIESSCGHNVVIEYSIMTKSIALVIAQQNEGEESNITRTYLDIKTLHQLQNLYHSLTGIELDVYPLY